MKIKYNVTGTRRKELVQTIADSIGADVKYKGAPTFAYEVDFFTITRDGTLEYPDQNNSEIVGQVLEELSKAGFEGEPEDETRDDADAVGLTISIPLEKVNCGNLLKLLDAKGNLIRKALGIDALPIEIGVEDISFPWFDELPEPDEVTAYTHFISALCQLSKEQKRIMATAKDVENEKYAFRCFLLRLGFIGPEYKAQRKILLKNLSGSSAFRGNTVADAGATD